MKWTSIAHFEQRKSADLLVLPVWEGGEEAVSSNISKQSIDHVLKIGDFKGKLGETFVDYPEAPSESPKPRREPRIVWLGLGKRGRATTETLRRSFAAAVRAANARHAKRVNFVVPSVDALQREDVLRGCFEGICLTNYAFLRLKSEASFKEDPITLIEEAAFIGLSEEDLQQRSQQLSKWEEICRGTMAVRDLVNDNADEITPEYLAKQAQKYAHSNSKLQVKIFDQKALVQERMGLILAVSRGSSVEPRFIELSYRGNADSKEHIVLVGKGVTYDTGGLSLKSTEGMLTMKCDMAGAAVVLETVHVAAQLGLKVNVTAIVPSVENCIDSKSYKPGDVYRSRSGKTVEIKDTDAEGRLILADALSYAVDQLHPSCIVDVATLTGAIVIALGEEMSGFFTADDRLAKELLAVSSETGELLWRMPLHLDYRDALKSDIADLVNLAGKDAGSIKAALFLREFTKDVPWAHIDIAGPVFLAKPKHYNTTRATGYGLRLLVAFLEGRAS